MLTASTSTDECFTGIIKELQPRIRDKKERYEKIAERAFCDFYSLIWIIIYFLSLSNKNHKIEFPNFFT